MPSGAVRGGTTNSIIGASEPHYSSSSLSRGAAGPHPALHRRDDFQFLQPVVALAFDHCAFVRSSCLA
jgi:hypothetical protein